MSLLLRSCKIQRRKATRDPERKKSNDDKFLEKERQGQKKYYTPVAKLSKTEHKKQKEAVRARVKKSREEASKLFKRVQELSQPSPSSSIGFSICSDSLGFVVKVSFPSKGNSSIKRRLERQQRARRKLQVLRTKTINYKNVMKLYKSDLKEKKKDFKKFEGGPDDSNTK